MSAFCLEQEHDVFESLMGVHESFVDSGPGEPTTMHVLGGQTAGCASKLDARL